MDTINEDSLETKTLIVTLPEVRIDSVIIELPEDSAVYQMDRKRVELTNTGDGAYYDLFGQLKEAVLELQSSVRVKALEKGILLEGEEMAEEYLRTFVKPLGYKVRFEPRLKSVP